MYNSGMNVESNCIGFVLSHFGFVPEDKYISPDNYHNLISPYFEEVHSLKLASALAIVLTEDPNLVIHMMVVGENRQTVTHRPGYARGFVTEPLYKALAFYSLGLREEKIRIAKLIKAVPKVG